MAGIQINRTATGVILDPVLSNEIEQETVRQSAVMQLARRIDLPAAGQVIQTITGDPEAQWVDETDEKPIGRSTFGSKTMRSYTLAIIEPFSNQFRRDLPALYNALAARLPGVLAKKFDNTVFFGTAPGSDFDTLTGVPTVRIFNDGTTNAYAGFLSALSATTAAGSNVTGWALSPAGEIVALSALDGNGRPIFTNSPANDGSIGRILGRPAFRSDAVYQTEASGVAETLGFAGDWNTAVYGVVQGITIDVTDQATLNDGGTPLNLWQRNMFAVRAEVEVGFRLRNATDFVRLTGDAALA